MVVPEFLSRSSMPSSRFGEVLKLNPKDSGKRQVLILRLKDAQALLFDAGVKLSPSQILAKVAALPQEALQRGPGGEVISAPTSVNCFTAISRHQPDLNLNPANPAVRGALIDIAAGSAIWPNSSKTVVTHQNGVSELTETTEWAVAGL